MVSRSVYCTALMLVFVGTGLSPAFATDTHGADELGSKLYVTHVPVHFPAGELVPENGLVVMWVNDLVVPQTGALFCQNEAGEDVCLPDDRTSRSFCDGVSLYDGRNWESGLDTYVYVGVPYDRLAPGVRCPQTTSGATTGEVNWWPGPAEA